MGGSRQRSLVERSRLTKQAVQQLVDDLEATGIVYRTPDSDDKRAKIIRYPEKGLAALRDGARIKHDIEARMTAGLGDEDIASLRRLLLKVVEAGFAASD